jgi:hypothetical protein
MTFELPRRVINIPSPFLIVCDGYSDVRLVDELLQHNKIPNCSVGCRSDDFGQNLSGYLKAIKAIVDINGLGPQGICVIVDADESRDKAFADACRALQDGDFPTPARPFVIEDLNPRVAVYVMPGENRDGTLEHLLLEATFTKEKKLEKCVDDFLACVGSPKPAPNKEAKMRMSALVAATCTKNPWASAAMIWHDKGNPVPIDSPNFRHLTDFLKRFSTI